MKGPSLDCVDFISLKELESNIYFILEVREYKGDFENSTLNKKVDRPINSPEDLESRLTSLEELISRDIIFGPSDLESPGTLIQTSCRVLKFICEICACKFQIYKGERSLEFKNIISRLSGLNSSSLVIPEASSLNNSSSSSSNESSSDVSSQSSSSSSSSSTSLDIESKNYELVKNICVLINGLLVMIMSSIESKNFINEPVVETLRESLDLLNDYVESENGKLLELYNTSLELNESLKSLKSLVKDKISWYKGFSSNVNIDEIEETKKLNVKSEQIKKGSAKLLEKFLHFKSKEEEIKDKITSFNDSKLEQEKELKDKEESFRMYKLEKEKELKDKEEAFRRHKLEQEKELENKKLSFTKHKEEQEVYLAKKKQEFEDKKTKETLDSNEKKSRFETEKKEHLEFINLHVNNIQQSLAKKLEEISKSKSSSLDCSLSTERNTKTSSEKETAHQRTSLSMSPSHSLLSNSSGTPKSNSKSKAKNSPNNSLLSRQRYPSSFFSVQSYTSSVAKTGASSVIPKFAFAFEKNGIKTEYKGSGLSKFMISTEPGFRNISQAISSLNIIVTDSNIDDIFNVENTSSVKKETVSSLFLLIQKIAIISDLIVITELQRSQIEIQRKEQKEALRRKSDNYKSKKETYVTILKDLLTNEAFKDYIFSKRHKTVFEDLGAFGSDQTIFQIAAYFGCEEFFSIVNSEGQLSGYSNFSISSISRERERGAKDNNYILQYALSGLVSFSIYDTSSRIIGILNNLFSSISNTDILCKGYRSNDSYPNEKEFLNISFILFLELLKKWDTISSDDATLIMRKRSIIEILKWSIKISKNSAGLNNSILESSDVVNNIINNYMLSFTIGRSSSYYNPSNAEKIIELFLIAAFEVFGVDNDCFTKYAKISIDFEEKYYSLLDKAKKVFKEISHANSITPKKKAKTSKSKSEVISSSSSISSIGHIQVGKDKSIEHNGERSLLSRNLQLKRKANDTLDEHTANKDGSPSFIEDKSSSSNSSTEEATSTNKKHRPAPILLEIPGMGNSIVFAPNKKDEEKPNEPKENLEITKGQLLNNGIKI